MPSVTASVFVLPAQSSAPISADRGAPPASDSFGAALDRAAAAGPASGSTSTPPITDSKPTGAAIADLLALASGGSAGAGPVASPPGVAAPSNGDAPESAIPQADQSAGINDSGNPAASQQPDLTSAKSNLDPSPVPQEQHAAPAALTLQRLPPAGAPSATAPQSAAGTVDSEALAEQETLPATASSAQGITAEAHINQRADANVSRRGGRAKAAPADDEIALTSNPVSNATPLVPAGVLAEAAATRAPHDYPPAKEQGEGPRTQPISSHPTGVSGAHGEDRASAAVAEPPFVPKTSIGNAGPELASAGQPREAAQFGTALASPVSPAVSPHAAIHGLASVGAAPEASTPAITAQPGRFGQELGVAIARHVASGGVNGAAETITLRLSPADMGRIDVRLAFDDSGTLRAVISADSPAALDMLRRDSADLGRALSDAGVRADTQTLRFDTRGGNFQSGGQSGNPSNDRDQPRQQPRETTNDNAPGVSDIADAYRPLRTRGNIDMVA